MSGILFQAGAPLLANSPVYIPREADQKAATHLCRMEYITLVEPRQHGKTSLINRLIGQFSSQGYTFAYRDLMAARSSDTCPAEWYASLGQRLLSQLRFVTWDPRPDPPTDSASWEDFLARLATNAEKAGQNVVIVLDEIGAMPTDWATGFFSVIRSVYTSRQTLPFWQHLTFIVAGVFNPKKLIQDDTVSNFNVDQRIPLDDFDLSQVKQLVAHLTLSDDRAEAVAERIHYWTDGQPYLSHRLCLYLAERIEIATVSNVDAVVDDAVERFFQDDTHHLKRIGGLADDPELLAYVQRITSESRPRFSAALNERHFRLAHIIGIIKAGPNGRCRIRNRVYERALAEVVKEQRKEGGQAMTELPPEVKSKAISFLLDIGKWAASELKERWKLARQKKDAEQPAEVDLSGPEEKITRDSEVILQDIAEEQGMAEVERVVKLIERKRDLIQEWRESKVDNEEAFNRQMITRAALRLRQQELGQKIRNALAEIEADLKELGVQVRKEEVG